MGVVHIPKSPKNSDHKYTLIDLGHTDHLATCDVLTGSRIHHY